MALTSIKASSCDVCAWPSKNSAALASSLSCTHHQQSRRSEEVAHRRQLAKRRKAMYPQVPQCFQRVSGHQVTPTKL